jgi:hypothetical protein
VRNVELLKRVTKATEIRQALQRVVRQAQNPELSEPSDGRRQRVECVVAEIQLGECSEAAKSVWERRDAVVLEAKHLQ